MTARRRDLLTLGAFLPVALAILLMLLRASGTSPLPAGGHELQAIVPTAVTLAPAAEVRVVGVAVGRVEKVVRRGPEAVVLMRLKDDAPVVFRDATVDIRARTVVGENFVQLRAGTPSAGALAPGEVLGPQHAAEATQFDDVAGLFDDATRGHLRGQVATLGTGLSGRGGRRLNRLLEGTAQTAADAAPVAATLAAQRADLARLVDQVGAVTRALGERRADIATLARRGSTAVAAIRDERQAVERTLEVLPGSLAQAKETTGHLAALSRHATQPLLDLRSALAVLEPSLDELAPTARTTTRALLALDRFNPRGARLLQRLRAAAPAVERTAAPLEQVLSQANPVLGYLRPYTAELGAFFGNLGSMVGTGDSLGRLARMSAIVSPSALATAPKAFVRLHDRLKSIDAVKLATGPHGINPYPRPGELLDPRPFTGSYPHVEAAPIPPR